MDSDDGQSDDAKQESKQVSLPVGAPYPGTTEARFLLHRWLHPELGQSLVFARGAIYTGISQFLAERGVLGYGVYAARDIDVMANVKQADYTCTVLGFYGGQSFPQAEVKETTHPFHHNSYNIDTTCRRVGECSQDDHKSGSTHEITVVGDPYLTDHVT